MPIPPWVARFNRTVTNRLTRPLASRLPGFGVVVHTGRRTGRTYRTPVNVFMTSVGYRVALTYGSRSAWVRNVRAAGECRLETRGRVEHLRVGALTHDPTAAGVPGPVGVILRGLHVTDFLALVRPGEDRPGEDRPGS